MGAVPGRRTCRAAPGYDGERYPRLAVQTPAQVPSEPVPRQEPRPELPRSRPLPLAWDEPELTLTDVAPFGATRPPTAKPPPPPETPPLRTSRRNIPPELQLPRVVVMVTHQDPSKGFAAFAVSATAVNDRANRAVPTARRKLGFTAPSPAVGLRANPPAVRFVLCSAARALVKMDDGAGMSA